LDINGENVLFQSLQNKDAHVLLLRTNIFINQLNLNNNSVLHYYYKNEYYDLIKLLIVRKYIDVNISDVNVNRRTLSIHIEEKKMENL